MYKIISTPQGPRFTGLIGYASSAVLDKKTSQDNTPDFRHNPRKQSKTEGERVYRRNVVPS